MAVNDSAERHRFGHQLFTKGDYERLSTDLLAPGTVWYSPGRNPVAGVYHGPDGVGELFGKMMEISGGSFQLHDVDFFGRDQNSIAISRLTAERDGRSLDVTMCETVRWEDGRITEERVYIDDQYAWDEFWS